MHVPTPAEVSAASAIVASIKNARDLVAGWKDSAEKRRLLAEFDDISDKVFELRRVLLETQDALAAAKERCAQLEQLAVKVEDWSSQAERYEMKEIARGVVAYTPKPGMEHGEAPHSLCASCFQNQKKSILQQDYHPRGVRYRCPSCDFTVAVRKPHDFT